MSDHYHRAKRPDRDRFPWAELEAIAKYPDRLLTPFDPLYAMNVMQDKAARALGWRLDKNPLPEQPHAPPPRDGAR